MKRLIVAGVLAVTPWAALARPAAQAAPVQAPPEPLARELSQPPALSYALTDEMIRKAVRDTIAEDPHPVAPAHHASGAFGASAPTAHDKMTAAFEQAKVPDCLHGDALKLQPAQIGPVAVVGPYSLPWVIAALIRGKCN